MIGEAFRDDVAAHPLAFEIDLGDQIDRPLIGDAEAGFLPRELDIPRSPDDVDRCGQKSWIGQGLTAGYAS